MRISDLETFVRLATLRNFRAVALQCNLTQPAVSARISALERQLGVVLFERGQHGVTLTAKGAQLLHFAERILDQATRMQAAASPGAVAGVVRLGVVETVAYTWLPDLLRRLAERYPNLSVELTVNTTVALREALVNRTLDIACLMGPISQPEIVNRFVCRYPLSWVVSPDLTRKARLDLGDIRSIPVITYPRLSRPSVMIAEMFREAGMSPGRFVWSGSLATSIRMVLDGLGVGVLPPAVVSDHLAEGRLLLVEGPGPLPDLDYTCSWPVTPQNGLVPLLADMMIALNPPDAAPSVG
ncbi:MAG: LysR family transcriptional regulator [Azospirillaceae bacterium]